MEWVISSRLFLHLMWRRPTAMLELTHPAWLINCQVYIFRSISLCLSIPQYLFHLFPAWLFYFCSHISSFLPLYLSLPSFSSPSFFSYSPFNISLPDPLLSSLLHFLSSFFPSLFPSLSRRLSPPPHPPFSFSPSPSILLLPPPSSPPQRLRWEEDESQRLSFINYKLI